MIRKPAVAGQFYPDQEGELSRMLDKLLADSKAEVVAEGIAFVAPHAGYAYSGAIAAHTYAALRSAHSKRKFDSLVVIGPNHTGYGSPIAVSMDDWQTPLGVVKNDIELSKLIASMPDMSADDIAHGFEHSVEVQLPFMQKTLPGVSSSFICMGDQSYKASVGLTNAITVAAKRLGRRMAVIASSDFNHYESAEIAKKKDMPAIDAILKLDAENFHEIIRRNEDSACGYGPITVAALFARRNGAKKGELLKYGNSGDATNDYKSVVAYASIVFV